MEEAPMPVNIRSVGPSSLPQEQPLPTSSQSSGPASPAPQDYQAKINQGIEQAAQNLDQILQGAIGGAVDATQMSDHTEAETTAATILKLKHDVAIANIGKI
jgi:hypothetical protein